MVIWLLLVLEALISRSRSTSSLGALLSRSKLRFRSSLEVFLYLSNLSRSRYRSGSLFNLFLEFPYNNGVKNAEPRRASSTKQTVTFGEGDYDICSSLRDSVISWRSFYFNTETDLFFWDENVFIRVICPLLFYLVVWDLLCLESLMYHLKIWMNHLLSTKKKNWWIKTWVRIDNPKIVSNSIEKKLVSHSNKS